MDLIIIIVFIVLILSCMIAAYVPYELQPLATQAGFSKFSLRFFLLRIQKVPIKYLFEQYIKLIDSDIDIEFEELKKYWSAKPDKLESTINIIINAKNAGLEIPVNEIDKYNLNETNSLSFFSVLKKLEKLEIKFSDSEIFELINSEIDIDSYFTCIVNAKKHNIDLTEYDINKIDTEEINTYINNIEKVIKLGNKPDLINESNFSWETKNILLNNILQVNQLNINISEKELIEIYKLEINTTEYIKAVELLQSEKFEGISQENIKEHFIKGGNSAVVLDSLLFAKANKTEIEPSVLFKIDLDKNTNLQDIIKKAVIPYEIDLPDTSPVVLQDGIQIIPKIKLSIKNNIKTYSSYVDKSSFFNTINEILISELLNFKTYQDVLSNIKIIVSNILKQISEKQKASDNIPFYITNLKIIDIDINADTLADLKEKENKAKKEDARLKILEANAKLQENMSEALKNGSMSFKDYQKEKHIFGSFDNEELPYSD